MCSLAPLSPPLRFAPGRANSSPTLDFAALRLATSRAWFSTASPSQTCINSNLFEHELVCYFQPTHTQLLFYRFWHLVTVKYSLFMRTNDRFGFIGCGNFGQGRKTGPTVPNLSHVKMRRFSFEIVGDEVSVLFAQNFARKLESLDRFSADFDSA